MNNFYITNGAQLTKVISNIVHSPALFDTVLTLFNMNNFSLTNGVQLTKVISNIVHSPTLYLVMLIKWYNISRGTPPLNPISIPILAFITIVITNIYKEDAVLLFVYKG